MVELLEDFYLSPAKLESAKDWFYSLTHALYCSGDENDLESAVEELGAILGIQVPSSPLKFEEL